MKRTIRTLSFLMIAISGMAGDGIPVADAQGANDDIRSLLDKTAARISSYPELKKWKASVISVRTEMDKTWEPKKVTRVLKTVWVADKKRTEHIIRAEETEKGVTKDITTKYVREMEERQQQAKKREEERKRERRTDEHEKQRYMFNLAELLPFSEKNWGKFTFAKLEDEKLDGRPVFVLRSSARVPSEDLWEGRYFISQDGYDVLKVILSLAKNPKFVKEFALEMEFRLLPSGHFVIQKSRMKVDAGMVLKHVRLLVEEEYTGYEIIAVEDSFGPDEWIEI